MSTPVLKSNNFSDIQQLLFEAGCLERPVFLVTGIRSFEQEKIQSALMPVLEKTVYQRFFEFDKNPKLTDVEKGIHAFRQLDDPIVVAIGGGSVLDMAKLIYFFGPLAIHPGDYFLKGERSLVPNLHQGKALLLAVPTTAGTGSEATQFATLYIDGVKYSLDDSAIRPKAVILDPELTTALPAKETAESGLDALTQAVESYWNVHSTDESKAYAREAIALIYPNLEKAVLRPTLAARQAMLQGAHLAGQAINLTRTTAAHAISYPMTSYFDIPHGQAVSLSLPYFLAFNDAVTEADVLDPRGVDYVRNTMSEIVDMLGCHSVRQAKERWISLMQRIGVKVNLSQLGIQPKDWSVIIQNGFNPKRVANNPRRLTEESLRGLLAQFSG